jgi:hypothetical protein
MPWFSMDLQGSYIEKTPFGAFYLVDYLRFVVKTIVNHPLMHVNAFKRFFEYPDDNLALGYPRNNDESLG